MIPLRILIADDHDVVRRGIRALLECEPGYEVVGEAANGREAVDAAKRLKPDVVVLDLSMPELNGFEATRQILRITPAVEVLVLTVHESDEVVREILRAGARGYLLKTDAGHDLVTAIESLREHKPYFTPKVSNLVLDGFLGGPPAEPAEAPSERLTAREREVLQSLAEGKTNKQTAAALGVRTKTVETHRANIMHKLGFHSLVELVRYAIRNRLIEP